MSELTIKADISVARARELMRAEGLSTHQIETAVTRARQRGWIGGDRFVRAVEIDSTDNRQISIATPRESKPPLAARIKTEVKELLLDQLESFAEDLELSAGFSVVEGGIRAEVVDASSRIKRALGNDAAIFRTTVTIRADTDRTLELSGLRTKLEAGATFELTFDIPHAFRWADPEGSPRQIARHEWANLRARGETAFEALRLDAAAVREKLGAGELPAHMSIGLTVEVQGGATFKGDATTNAERTTRYIIQHDFEPGSDPATAARVNTTLRQRRADAGGVSGSFEIESYIPKLFGDLSSVSQVTVEARDTTDEELGDTLLLGGGSEAPALVKPSAFDERSQGVRRSYQFDSTMRAGTRVVIPIEAVGGLSVSGAAGANARERINVTVEDVNARDGERLAALWARRDMQSLFADDDLAGGRFQTVFARERNANFGVSHFQGWGNRYIGARAVASFVRNGKETDQTKLAVTVDANGRARVVIERFSGEALTRKLSAEIGVEIPSSLETEIAEALGEYMIGGDLLGLRDKVIDELGAAAVAQIEKYAEMAKVSMAYERSSDDSARETIEFEMSLGDPVHRRALDAMADESKSWAERLEPALALGAFDVARLRDGERHKTDFNLKLAVLKYNLSRQTTREDETVQVNAGGSTMNIRAASGEFVKNRDGFATDTHFRFRLHHVSADGHHWNTMAVVQYHADEANFWRSEADAVVGAGRALDAEVETLEMDRQRGFWGWFNRNVAPGEENMGEGTVDLVAVFGGNAAREILTASPREAYDAAFQVASDIAGVAGPVTHAQIAAVFGVPESVVRALGSQSWEIVHDNARGARRTAWKRLSTAHKELLVPDEVRRERIEEWLDHGRWPVLGGRNREARRFDRAMAEILPESLVHGAAQPEMLTTIRENYDPHINRNADEKNNTLDTYLRRYRELFNVDPQTHMWIEARADVARDLAAHELFTESRAKLVAIESRERLVRDRAATMLRTRGISDEEIAALMVELPFNARPDRPESWGPVGGRLLDIGFTRGELAAAATALDDPTLATRHALEASAAQWLLEAGVPEAEIGDLLARVPANAALDDPGTWGILPELSAHGITGEHLTTASALLTEVRSMLEAAAADHARSTTAVPGKVDVPPQNQLDDATLESLFDGVLEVVSRYSQANSIFTADKDIDALALYATMASLAPDDTEAFFTVETDRMRYVASTDGFFDANKRINKEAEIRQLIAIAKAGRR